MDWVHEANCRAADPDLFFPVGTSGPALAQAAAAKAVCATCDVRPDCLEWAIANGQDTGVWGGCSEDELRAERRARRRRVRASVSAGR